jgi:hypothetical protein
MERENKADYKKSDSRLAVDRAIRLSKQGRVPWEKAARIARDTNDSSGCEKLHEDKAGAR